jgi:hypothetical protein
MLAASSVASAAGERANKTAKHPANASAAYGYVVAPPNGAKTEPANIRLQDGFMERSLGD